VPHTIGTVMLAALLLVTSGSWSHAITCSECREIEKSKRSASQELKDKRDEMQKANEQKQYQKVTALSGQLAALRKKLLELDKNAEGCAAACKPDVVKREECRAIQLEIVKMESDSSQTGEQIKQIDDLYGNLSKCNKELRVLLGVPK